MADDQKSKPGLVDDALDGLTYKVTGLAMAVHNDLGPGHREETYHNAMTQRFVDAGLPAEREPDLPIFDENGNMVNFYRPDHRVDQKLLAEHKAHSHPINNDEIAQCLDYFAASDCGVLLIFNFPLGMEAVVSAQTNTRPPAQTGVVRGSEGFCLSTNMKRINEYAWPTAFVYSLPIR